MVCKTPKIGLASQGESIRVFYPCSAQAFPLTHQQTVAHMAFCLHHWNSGEALVIKLSYQAAFMTPGGASRDGADGCICVQYKRLGCARHVKSLAMPSLPKLITGTQSRVLSFLTLGKWRNQEGQSSRSQGAEYEGTLGRLFSCHGAATVGR